jgi:hypothetical protein
MATTAWSRFDLRLDRGEVLESRVYGIAGDGFFERGRGFR